MDTNNNAYMYVNDEITFNNAVSGFSLSSVTPYVKTGKTFIGWTKNGEAADETADYEKNDVLTAQYADTANAFRVVGARAEKSGMGLRFLIEKSDLLEKAIGEVIEYGTLVLPTELTRGHDFKYAEPMYNEYAPALPDNVSVTAWGTDIWSSTDGPKIVPAGNSSVSSGESVIYSVCISNISEKHYDRFYMVKGYARFTDLNGNIRTAYTDYYQTNLYNAVCDEISAGDTSAELAAVKTYYETTRKSVYMAEQYDNRTDLRTQKIGGAMYSWLDTEGSADIEGIENKAFYKLKNGLKIREVEYDLGGGNRESVEIVQFADAHMNYVNDRDWAEGSSCILATYKGREWNRNGDSVPGINKMMKYASFFDKGVVTGDLLDYFSWGCGEMVKKLIVERNPALLMAVGNHEPVVHMQDVAHECNTDNSTEAAYARLQSFWTNDTKYASEIIKNKDGVEMAKLIVIDDQQHKFVWEEVYNGLKADIADAREKNIPVLLFMHCPMSTRGGAEEDRYSYFYEPGDVSGFNAQEDKKIDLGKREAGSSESETDRNTYELITNNADVIRGIFCGDYHNNMYTEVKGFNNGDKNDVMMIPQYVVTANAYGGSAIKIKIK